MDADALATAPIEDVRAERAQLIEVETGLSYLRRMVQGPLDIVRAELARRGAGEGSDLASLVDELPDLLADGTRVGGNGRLPRQLEPTRIDPELEAELAGLLARAPLAELASAGTPELAGLAEDLDAFERRVSERRRAEHQRIDALQAELTRRYRDGEASVESLLG